MLEKMISRLEIFPQSTQNCGDFLLLTVRAHNANGSIS